MKKISEFIKGTLSRFEELSEQYFDGTVARVFFRSVFFGLLVILFLIVLSICSLLFGE